MRAPLRYFRGSMASTFRLYEAAYIGLIAVAIPLFQHEWYWAIGVAVAYLLVWLTIYSRHLHYYALSDTELIIKHHLKVNFEKKYMFADIASVRIDSPMSKGRLTYPNFLRIYHNHLDYDQYSRCTLRGKTWYKLASELRQHNIHVIEKSGYIDPEVFHWTDLM